MDGHRRGADRGPAAGWVSLPRARRYVVAIGGERIDAVTTIDAVEAYDIIDREWRPLPPLRIPRHGLAVAAIGSVLYALGGSDGGGSPTGTTAVEVLDLAPLLDGCG